MAYYHKHTLRQDDRDYNLTVICQPDGSYALIGDLDPEEEPDCPIMVEKGTLTDIIKAFADWQWTVADPYPVFFYFEETGQDIPNPWIDPSGRFPLDTVEAVKEYGAENVTKFISDATIYLFNLKEA